MQRVVLHLDCDCFYAQVELQRLSLPPSTPLCVLQWGSTLAVSYPARGLGIKRGDSVHDIRRKGGAAVRVVSVDTIGDAGARARDDDGDVAARDYGHAAARRAQATEKVSLARYREASAAVFRAVARALGAGARLERASIDECFVDVTDVVAGRLRARRGEGGMVPEGAVVEGGVALREGDAALVEGARVAEEVRAAVKRDATYALSAGVAWNKMLAKHASARNKPDGLTLVVRGALEGLLRATPLAAFRGCGGKLGEAVARLGWTCAADVRDHVGMREMTRVVGERHARFVWDACRGVDPSEVVCRQEARSLLAAKSFGATRDVAVAERWMRVLAAELVERMAFEAEFHARRARTLTFSFRVRRRGEMVSVSRGGEMPAENVRDRANALLVAGRSALAKLLRGGEHVLPISFVGMTASNFVDRAQGARGISKFFAARAVAPGGESGAEAVPGEEPAAAGAEAEVPAQCQEEGVPELGEGVPVRSASPGPASSTVPGSASDTLTTGDSMATPSRPARAAPPANKSPYGRKPQKRAARAMFVPSEQGKVSSTKEESDLAHARRVQEAADLEMARRLAREDDGLPCPAKRKKKKAPASISSFFSSSGRLKPRDPAS